MAVKGKKGTKNPPIMSHEFVIQNHADLVSCVAMVFVLGLMFQVSTPLASVFIVLQHNVSLPVEVQPGNYMDMTFYTPGIRDLPTVFFYFLIAIVVHAIIQEYVLDKVNKKLHLSKAKHNRFDESGQLASFYIVSMFAAGDLIFREQLFNISMLWEGYPHNGMTFAFKFFFIAQIAYWLHVFPELYFQKVKKEDMAAKIQYASLYLAFIVPAYYMRFSRVCMVLLFVHYAVEAVYHVSRLLTYAELSVAKKLFKISDALFVMARLGSVILAVLTFWFGLAKAPADQQELNFETGNFNTSLVRLNCLIGVCLLQAALMYSFIMAQMRRSREATSAAEELKSSAIKKKNLLQEKAKQRQAKREQADLPEVDQDTVRQRVK
jgi:translocating chain-associated membrane protein 1